MKDKYGLKSITLIDEGGRKLEFEVVDLLSMEEQEYAVLVPLGENGPPCGRAAPESSEEVVIMRIAESGGEITLQDIDDEDERQRVADIAFEGQFEQREG